MRIVSSRQSDDLGRPRDTMPARIRPLSVLPVFFDLKGKRAVVIGGSEAAVWKAELLSSAGAETVVFAATPERDMLALVARACKAGSLRLVRREFTDADLAGAAIIVADAEDEADAERIVAAARRVGVPVNVIDKPVFSDFQFGSIVNRSPLIVSISTDGGAPILGQAVRRRIETLLPHYLGAWTAIAKSLRQRVAEALKPGAERRRFWELFSDRAFAGEPDGNNVADLFHAANKFSEGAAAEGNVTLVSAGPGDAELLTIKAVRALQSADVILFDHLVPEEVLELARREAKRMLVGRRGERTSCRQEDTNELMAGLARAGKHVVRLASGDPMLFERARGEIARLEGQGIPVSIVWPAAGPSGMDVGKLRFNLHH